MAKVIQVLDVNSDGHRVRLDDGRCVLVPHGHGEGLSVGSEVPAVYKTTPIPPDSIAPSLDFLESPEQILGNILSDSVAKLERADASREPG